MKDKLVGAELIEHWRNGGQDNPAGPLFSSGPFAEADITTNDCGHTACGTQCSSSLTLGCC
jgi:hypothetical protein